MTRLERVAVLFVLIVVLALLVGAQPVSAGLGALAGVALGLAVEDRLRPLRRRIDRRLGADLPVPRTGVRVEVVVRRVLVQVAVLGGLLVVMVLVPGIGDDAFAVLAAGATALPATLTAQRLRG